MPLGANFDRALTAAKRGAEWAWGALFDDLAGALYGYLRLRGAAEPDDVVGEVFLDLARNIESFSGDEAAFRSWVFLIAHHRLQDERRARARRPAEPLDMVDLTAEEDVERIALGQVSSDRVRELLFELTPDQREVVMLRVVAELSIEQTARILGKRPNAVKALQHRAVARLRRRIEAEGVTK